MPIPTEELKKAFEDWHSVSSRLGVEPIADWWLEKLAQREAIARKEGESIERQFILNVLDGIDIVDEAMGNNVGGTKAIRLALQSRMITQEENKEDSNSMSI